MANEPEIIQVRRKDNGKLKTMYAEPFSGSGGFDPEKHERLDEDESAADKAPDYESKTVEQLEALVPEDAEIEGSGKDGRVLKKDLVDYLNARDDAE